HWVSAAASAFVHDGGHGGRYRRAPGRSGALCTPELDHNGRKQRRAMDDATLWDMARRIPMALAQSARLSWSVDRTTSGRVRLCQATS
ncbi:hypothetical protein ACWGCF_42940, partial [Streptomyces sp. NPDC055039]